MQKEVRCRTLFQKRSHLSEKKKEEERERVVGIGEQSGGGARDGSEGQPGCKSGSAEKGSLEKRSVARVRECNGD